MHSRPPPQITPTPWRLAGMRTYMEAIFDRIAAKQEWWSPAGLQALWQACVPDSGALPTPAPAAAVSPLSRPRASCDRVSRVLV